MSDPQRDYARGDSNFDSRYSRVGALKNDRIASKFDEENAFSIIEIKR